MGQGSVVEDKIVAIAKHRFSFGCKIGELSVPPPDYVEAYFDDMRKAYYLSVEHKFFAYEHDKKVIKYPTTWWDAFKERFIPFSKIKYTTYTIEYDILLPDINEKLRNMVTFPYVNLIKSDTLKE